MSALSKKLEELITRVHAVSDNFSAYPLSFERDLLEDALRAALHEACAAQREEDAKVCDRWADVELAKANMKDIDPGWKSWHGNRAVSGFACAAVIRGAKP